MSNIEKNKMRELAIEEFSAIEAAADNKAADNKNVRELIIREGRALEKERALNVKLSGVIDSPLKYIEKRKTEFDQLLSHIIVNRDKNTIQLVINEHDPVLNRIEGKLEYHRAFKTFDINTCEYRSVEQMAELIKMNRSYFENHTVAMKLTHELKNFRGKVNKEVEKADNNRGNKKLLVDQVVESNVPEKFNLVLPIFKGQPKETIEVEVYFNADDITCTLVSPQANDIIEQIRDGIIDQQIEQISDQCPQLVIIEE